MDSDQFRAAITRHLLGYATDKAFCKETGINETAWNEVVNGKRNISKGQARAIRQMHGVSLDWTLGAELAALPAEGQKIVRVALAEKKLPTLAA